MRFQALKEYDHAMKVFHIWHMIFSRTPFVLTKSKITIWILFYQDIQEAISRLPPPLAGRAFALTEGF